MTLNYMNRDQLCTVIRADFEYFLEDRCFPRTRYNLKELLEEMDLPMYDPLLIIGKTKGRVYGDYQWIDIVEE